MTEFIKALPILIAIPCVTAIILAAISKDIDGAVLMSGLTIVGALAGWKTAKGRKPPPPSS